MSGIFGGISPLVLLGSSTLSGTAATVTFTGIPGGYEALWIIMQGRGDNASTTINAMLQFNNDTAGNYDWQYVAGAGSTASAGSGAAQTSAFSGAFAAANAPASSPGSIVLWLPKYDGTTFHKTLVSCNGYRDGTSTQAALYARASWRSTAAITEIDINASAGNFIAGSSFALYGVKV